MKFKGELHEEGTSWLKLRLAPVLERLGKEVTLLLAPKSVTFIQDAATTQGIRVHATFAPEVLFQEYGIRSQNEDKICFRLNTSMLMRVLRSIEDDFEKVEIRLVKRRVSEQDQQQMPFLNFSTTSSKLNIVQDLPLIGKPFQPAELQAVEQTLPSRDNPAVAPPYFLDIQPLVVSQLPQVVDRLKYINDVVQLATTQAGDLHLHAETMAVGLGSEYCGLKVLPQEQARPRSANDAQAHTTPSSRLQESLRKEEAHQVSVRARDLARCLLCHNTKPDRLLCGISRNKGFVQLALQYIKAFTDRINPGVVLHIKMPVQVEG
mmetsp:Transcript_38476/g.73722  ORF Transcript_38476/g.73722 Transcript_38476/m.73722 type:complete len:320 (+) Transcript_38476:257-1216(+)|eukprot:CAMPEP_0114238936 /NCGR_PEP_ID=MMETSP0058-20121206/8184_1 /TAXON_ID=36894 /ORGANISM="Pyramimonas parkeae, CCMP726" /LENGTH=319 /DNA_ID=CAMNT_0001351067 /DNA_START=137 /DNA_END=1096 /DNA_ORIENTATION=+